MPPFVPAARKSLQDLTELDIRAAQWTDFRWSTEYSECSSDLRASFLGQALGQWGWACPDHHGSGSTACGLVLGVFSRPCANGALLLHRIASVALQNKPQNTSILTCLVHRAPSGIRGLAVLDVNTRCWLSTITVSI